MKQRTVRVHDLLCVSIFGVLPLRTRHAAGCPKHREQIVFREKITNRYLLAEILSARALVLGYVYAREAYPRFSNVITS